MIGKQGNQLTKENQSTPNSSNSDLNLIPLQNNQNSIKKSNLSNYIVSTMFNDISKLKKEFGTFKLYGDVDSITWFAKVSAFL